MRAGACKRALPSMSRGSGAIPNPYPQAAALREASVEADRDGVGLVGGHAHVHKVGLGVGVAVAVVQRVCVRDVHQRGLDVGEREAVAVARVRLRGEGRGEVPPAHQQVSQTAAARQAPWFSMPLQDRVSARAGRGERQWLKNAALAEDHCKCATILRCRCTTGHVHAMPAIAQHQGAKSRLHTF